MQLFDAHCHLQDEELAGQLDAVMARAGNAGVAGFACCATEEADWPAVEQIGGRFSGVVSAWGFHPWHLDSRSPGWMERLRERLQRMPSAGVGEIGLDHGIEQRNDQEQMAVFLEQLDLARDLRRPVSIHCRQAWGAMMPALERVGRGLPGFVIHSYSGAVDHIEPLARAGAYFSFSGTITRPKNTRAKNAARAVPPDRLLIETDSPDLLPFRDDLGAGGSHGVDPNEPANLVYVCRTVAGLREMPADELADLTRRNANRLFLGKEC